jgi:cytochrome c oxidase cbb3-type subunit III
MFSKTIAVHGRWRTLIAFGGLMACVILVAGWPAQKPTKNTPQRANIAAGKRLFERHCSLCHGIDGKGGRGPALNRVHLALAPDDEELRSVIVNGIPPNMPEGWFLDTMDVANLVAFVRSLSKIPPDPIPGDAVRGAAVYAKSGCSGCHILNGTGAGFGPELTGIGELRNAAFLKKAISNPASALPESFLFVKATTASGESIEGIRVDEDSFTIQIKDAQGNYHSLRKAELKALQKLRGQSPMPSFGATLSVAEVQDLVAYLASQRGKQ